MKIATSIFALVSLLVCLPAHAGKVRVGGGPDVDWICSVIDEHTGFDFESCPLP